MSKRRSLLFIPGNSPGMVQNAGVFDADSVIFDLEDAVSIDEKDAARDLVCSALKSLDFGETEKIVRVNPMDTIWGASDVFAIARVKPHAILVPKATEEAIRECDEILSQVEKEASWANGEIQLIALLETAYGVEFSSDIIRASSRIKGVLLGGEDFTADMEVKRTRSGEELSYVRRRLSTLCKANKLNFIDTPFADVNDVEGLRADLNTAVEMGATGKAAINPRQVAEIHKAFTPDPKSIQWAREVVEAWDEAQSINKGVFSLHGKMIDAPVYNRAKKVLEKIG